MVHPPRPGAQCRHHTPEGLSSSSTCASLQHIEQSPQARPGTVVGIFVSPLMTGTDLTHDARWRHGAIIAMPLSTPSAHLLLPLPGCHQGVPRFAVGPAEGRTRWTGHGEVGVRL